MNFIIGIDPDTKKSAFGVVVLDSPGCLGAGETLIEDGLDTPPTTSIAKHQRDLTA